MRSSIIFVFILLFFTCSSQEILEHPSHPKGINSNNQYKAIPFYNEAFELYHNGEVEQAKESLHEAVNTSFALVEAQLFLGQIYYDQGRLDSALIYLNSGIDFEIDQPAHFYFMLFEVGMKHELYDVVKHNLKHFNTFYKDVDYGEYDSLYPYTVDDYEFYKNSLEVATNHHYWKPSAKLITSQKVSSEFNLSKNEIEFKKNKVLDFSSTQDSNSWTSNGLSFQTRKENNIYISFYRLENKSKWIALPIQFNDGNWNGHFFYSKQRKLIYFSSDRNGSKDLFVVKFDPDNLTFGEVCALDRVNTKGDEIFPSLVNDTFYFSSDGLPGFGGFDIFFTPDYSIMDNILYPSKWYNLGKPYNSGDDEKQILVANRFNYVKSQNWNGSCKITVYEPREVEPPFDYEIKMNPEKLND